MNFSIERLEENGLSLVRLRDTVTKVEVDILPAYGALLHAFRIPVEDQLFNIIDNYRTNEEIEEQLGRSFKSSKLSPFVCRIPGGKYHWIDKDYEITTKFFDGSAIHGLLYNKPFLVGDEYVSDELASIRLKYHYKKNDPGYPFDYTCEVVYMLHPGAVLQVETTILNLDPHTIPIADGWHPYFTLGGKIDNYEMQFASDSMLQFDEKLIPTGRIISDPSFKEPALIKDRKFDNCFLLLIEEGKPCCVIHNPENSLSLSFFVNNNYPYLQIYTPDHRNSIAIENLSGAPDCFNNGMGLKSILPRHSETFNVWYRAGITAQIE